MADDVFAESLKSPESKEVFFNCSRNVGRQIKDIYTLAHSTQGHQTKGDKFKGYRVKKDKIIEDIKSEVDSLSTKIEKLEKLQGQEEQHSRRNCLLVHVIAEEKEEITNEMIINTLNDKLDLDITLQDIKRTHQIREPKKTR